VNISDMPVPTSDACNAAATVVVEFSSPALVNHCHRSYLLAAALAESEGVSIDHELLYVSSMLHDLGLEPAFDNVTLPFEDAGAHVVSVFAAGAGWTLPRRQRAAEIVIAHMQDDVDPGIDPEGYLLEAATSLDISGRDPDRWPGPLLGQVYARYPRLDLARRFTACFEDQAQRKPDSTAAAAIRSGLADRIRANSVGRDAPRVSGIE
jgi:hypothetical protein